MAMKTAKKPTAAPARRHFRQVHLLSDSTGNLARHMMAAFATQFPPGTFDIRPRAFLRFPALLDAALRDIAKSPGIVLHAFLSDQAKQRTNEFCSKAHFPCRDLTGDFVAFLSQHGGVQPGCDPDRLHEMDENYRRRIKALEFGLLHDDGLGLETLHEADVVLSGVSRTGKTPTTIHLGQQGILAGNVSLVGGVDPPRELISLPRNKVIGLTIDPARLVEIRRNRQRDFGATLETYSDYERVAEEVQWSRDIFRRNGWRVLDVTNQAIEEIAARAMEIVRSLA
jgi:regulator of PEP synthase PpsR (kinase-PPPase family)